MRFTLPVSGMLGRLLDMTTDSPAVGAYERLAPVYDEVMKSFPYHQWLEYIDELCTHFSCRPRRVLDVACGTGTFALMLARRGTGVVGVDRSEAMVRVARGKAGRAGLAVPFLVQDMSRLALRERFELVVCMYDSINYLVDRAAMAGVLAGVARVLAPQGLFIFDMNTAYGLDRFWGNRTVVQEVGDTTLKWVYSYDPGQRLAGLELIFERGDGEPPCREEHLERAYSRAEMKGLLERAGLVIAGVTEDRSMAPPGRYCDRVWYVVRRP